MSASRNPRSDTARPQEQQTPQPNTNSGEGSSSALAAMLKKRREGENHPDEAADPAAQDGTGSS